jgi:hypothetical protein
MTTKQSVSFNTGNFIKGRGDAGHYSERLDIIPVLLKKSNQPGLKFRMSFKNEDRYADAFLNEAEVQSIIKFIEEKGNEMNIVSGEDESVSFGMSADIIIEDERSIPAYRISVSFPNKRKDMEIDRAVTRINFGTTNTIKSYFYRWLQWVDYLKETGQYDRKLTKAEIFKKKDYYEKEIKKPDLEYFIVEPEEYEKQ